MTKLFGFIIAAAIGIAAPAQANTIADIDSIQTNLKVEAQTLGLDWKVGDKADYKMNIGGFIKGTSKNFVREELETSFWMVQDMKLGMAGKQMMAILINKTTGQIEKLLVNGKEQEVPNAGDVEIIETKEATVRVPAGEFPCMYAKIKTSSGMQEVWLNPQAVPMGGNLKVLADSQFGKVTQELTAFEFAPREIQQ